MSDTSKQSPLAEFMADDELSELRRLIAEMWPYRNDYFGVRLMLRSMIRRYRLVEGWMERV